MPELFIDCTFETMGKLQLVDYSMLRHAECNSLSNFDDPAPLGPLRVRQTAWWRAPATTASALIIGNQRLDDPGWELALQSVVGSFPILLGDPRKISPSDRARIRRWASWLRATQDRHDFLSFREDVPGFGEPAEGQWDASRASTATPARAASWASSARAPQRRGGSSRSKAWIRLRRTSSGGHRTAPR